MKFRVLWDILPCSQIDVDRRFRGARCLHHQGDYTPEDYELNIRRRENLKFHKMKLLRQKVYKEANNCLNNGHG
jgi:hypothetical protein